MAKQNNEAQSVSNVDIDGDDMEENSGMLVSKQKKRDDLIKEKRGDIMSQIQYLEKQYKSDKEIQMKRLDIIDSISKLDYEALETRASLVTSKLDPRINPIKLQFPSVQDHRLFMELSLIKMALGFYESMNHKGQFEWKEVE